MRKLTKSRKQGVENVNFDYKRNTKQYKKAFGVFYIWSGPNVENTTQKEVGEESLFTEQACSLCCRSLRGKHIEDWMSAGPGEAPWETPYTNLWPG